MNERLLMKDYFDQPLFIFEMANNHMGSLEQGRRMIREFADIANRFDHRFAFKFQFRNIASFIHPDFRDRIDLRYIKRFKETSLSKDDFAILTDDVKKNKFISICTPFDESSVDLIEELGIEIIKIASCSFTDWPLLERIAKTDRPIIASTAGATLEEIDGVISFLQHRSKQFAIMHCVGEYPTKAGNLQMNQIDLLKRRYPGVPVGFSTHENPDDNDAVKIAIAKGAVIFERHVAVETPEFKKNDYSSTPAQTLRWLEAAELAFAMCGVENQRAVSSEKELADLRQFKRGVFANRKILKGERIDQSNTFFAFPNQDNQALANSMSKYVEYYAIKDIENLAPVNLDDVDMIHTREKIYNIVQQIKLILEKGNVVVPGRADLEISHHFGIDKFGEIGCTIINVINREYCKKLIIVLPGQKHPEQFHKIKEETFVVLHGDVLIELDGVPKECKKGDIVTVDRGVRHIFSSKGGAIIEEISSTHFKDDSYYTDENILKNKNRKTVLTYWME
jgi:sialic acid synthase SpsE/mannose-6-phosphate isomerase-like protein (cupin superfamily)